MINCYSQQAEHAVPIFLIQTKDYDDWRVQQTAATQSWLNVNSFKAKTGDCCLLPDDKGQLQAVAVGISDVDNFWSCADLAKILPAGNYQIDNKYSAEQLHDFAVAWGLGAYQFSRYKKRPKHEAKLLLSDAELYQSVHDFVDAIYTVRDLINTPAEDCGPADLAAFTKQLAEQHQAHYQEWIGEQLLQDNFPTIHRVGRASNHEPRLLELTWGDESHPQLTLVGKGVCFDTGGLNLKPGRAMLQMKKDMAGAAHVLGLAQLIITKKLALRLRVLIPAVENAVSANSFRPGDVVITRQGTSVEVSNTDAEGRLILADSLSYACEQTPDLLIDFASLTGAARAALGTDVAVMFTNQDELADACRNSSQATRDPLWQLPLYQAYRSMIDSNVADIDNSGNSPYAGAITAALFLQTFVKEKTPWIHLDMMAWNQTSRPGRPQGGEAHALRAIFDVIQRRYKQQD